MKRINFNGQILPIDQAGLTPKNRAFRYGDALFESIRMFDGKLPFLNYHIERLTKGMRILGYKIPEYYAVSFFKQEIEKLTQTTGNYRIRLTVFRQDGGLYTPVNNQVNFIIEAEPITGNCFVFHETGLKANFYTEHKIPMTRLSSLKTCNALPYVLAARFCKKNKLDDCLMFNTADRVVESYKANLFFVHANKVFTPPVSDGGIEGTMRKIVINVLKEMNINVVEQSVVKQDIKFFKAILLTNAIKGVDWISDLNGNTFQPVYVKDILKKLNKKFAD